MHFIPTEQYDADVLVAGGGPAGASCAYHLAQSGYRVILIDFAEFPRDKVCGDFVGPVAIRELEGMGITADPLFQQTNVIRNAAVYLDGVHLLTKEIPSVGDLPDHGRVIPRELLDNWILEKAKSRGVRVITSCKLQHYTNFSNAVVTHCKTTAGEMTFTTRYLVGADGSNSTLARLLNGSKPEAEYRIIAVRAYYKNAGCTGDQAELYFTSKSFPGYYWFFPTGPDTANVGIGMVVDNFPAEEINLKKLLEDLIANDATLRAKMAGAELQGKIVGWPLSTYNPDATIVAGRVLLAGDAAGLINSLNGEGIQYALLSGRWAAEALTGSLRGDGSLLEYTRRVKSKLALDMNLSNLVIQVIRNRNLNSVWLHLLSYMSEKAAADSRYADTAGGILAGLIPSQAALHPSFIGKSVQQVVSSLAGQAMREARQGPFGLPVTGMRLAGYTIAQLGNAVQQREQYWQWSKGIARKGMRVSGNLLEQLWH
jgi:geranylgeranyl reductase family protein